MSASASLIEGGNQPSVHMTGDRALAEMLWLHGAGPMFGMGGFQMLSFYEAARALALKHNPINDEWAAPSRPTPMRA